MTESEIKLTITDRAVLEAVPALGRIATFDVEDLGVTPHTDTYFDTPDLRLYHGRLVLRLRVSAAGSVLTCKAEAPGDTRPGTEGLFRRIEVEAAVHTGPEGVVRGDVPPDCPPMKALYDRLGIVPLTPALTVTNDRHTLLLRRGGTVAMELVLDDVEFCGARGTARVMELELETRDCGDDDLREAAGWLRERYPLAPAGPSKYIHGMDLVVF